MRWHFLNAFHLFFVVICLLGLSAPVALAVELDPSSAAGGKGSQTYRSSGSVAQTESLADLPAGKSQNRITILPGDRASFEAKIWTDRRVYEEGDPIRIYFRVTRDAYVYIFDTDTRRRSQQIFPNYYDEANFLRADVTYSIPLQNYRLRVNGPRGKETLDIVAVSERADFLERYESIEPEQPFPRPAHGKEGFLYHLDRENRRRALLRERQEIMDRRPRRDHDRPELREDAASGIWGEPSRKQEAESEAEREGKTVIVVGPSPYAEILLAQDRTVFDVRASYGYSTRQGRVRITTMPSGARVYVDGAYLGKSTLTVELSRGVHEVLVESECRIHGERPRLRRWVRQDGVDALPL